ncbi:hypothetical protein FA09DRAFT_341367 [Tilletiopsis washingtonensis]|uniref:Uncharacterized protein n=1 Tax=Tilletiopsis washingtonensis TaxID=58919 RepID=A0A316Z2H0_9BASI|nr:hypothetical protein FA09DRAFT_341367 [Tilletiopsis washingtonensis]PWN95158.1 hypothetical protein FA09DRAFT_341367 [Tilletiopsis washingtonensis]
MSTSVPILYGPSAHVPLIKDPSLRVPPPIAAPQDLHPLPPSLADYFVYPFTLERAIVAERERREAARRAELHRLAPGWDEQGQGAVLVPTPRAQQQQQQQRAAEQATQQPRGPMDELVDHLAALDAKDQSNAPPSGPLF